MTKAQMSTNLEILDLAARYVRHFGPWRVARATISGEFSIGRDTIDAIRRAYRDMVVYYEFEAMRFSAAYAMRCLIYASKGKFRIPTEVTWPASPKAN